MAFPRLAFPRLAFYGAAAFVGVLSLVPGGAVPPTHVSDKLEHFLAYAALGLVGVATARSGNRAVLTIVGIIAFGIAIEFLQMLAPGRYAELGDGLADAAGAIIGGLLAMALCRKRVAASAL
ncbi:MAG TPA: VanZ family protein [Dongiaceae bacterium]|nr:VanZ family protein [Dongiaceae bacterium]